MATFSEKFPGVEIVVQEDTTARLVKLALSCEIDFALASRPIHEKRLKVQELFSEELLVALPPGHPLTCKRTLNASELDGARLIVMNEGHCLGNQVLGFCDRQNLSHHLSFRSAQLETIQSLVRVGLGISLIRAMAARRDRTNGPEYRSQRSPRPSREIIAIWPAQRPLSPAASEFVKTVSTRFQ
jgi:LysR family hydrogen peroxide-inducible transcriptional activator